MNLLYKLEEKQVRNRNLKDLLGSLPFFLILNALFYLLNLSNEYYPILTIADLILPVSCLLLGISILMFLIPILMGRGKVKYALLLFFAQTAFLYFRSWHDFLKKNMSFLSHYTVIVPLFFLASVFIFIVLKKRSKPNARLFTYLNSVGLVLVIIELAKSVSIACTNGQSRFWFDSKTPTATAPNTKCDSCLKPDIYYLVFDEYSASRTLKGYWDYDNHELDSFLRKNGFFYAYYSRSNYSATPISIGSTLNMDYYNEKMDTKLDLPVFCKAIVGIEKNRVCEILLQNDYQIINHSGFPLPGQKPAFSVDFLFDKTEVILAQTFWGRMVFDIGWNFKFLERTNSIPQKIVRDKGQMSLTQKTYDRLLKTSRQNYKKPVFVYTHFLMPHHPYFYDSTGSFTSPTNWYGNIQNKERYLSQLKYTNTLIMDIVTRLKADSQRPRVLIVQSDHGFRGFTNTPLVEGTSNQYLEFNNLNAFFFPDKTYQGLYDSITSVNTFRVVLNKYLKIQKPLLKDSIIYIKRE